MSSIYDRLKSNSNLPSSEKREKDNDFDKVVPKNDGITEAKVDDVGYAPAPSKDAIGQANAKELNSYLSTSAKALEMVDNVVLKQYLTKLTNYDVLPISENEVGKNVILFKINKMVYEKDEFATDKFISVVSAMTYTDCSIFLIVDGFKDRTDFYLGVRNNNSEDKSTRSVAETFRASLKGQFPGIKFEDISTCQKNERRSRQDILLDKLKNSSTVSSCVGVPSLKDEDGNYTNANYIQGIEKLALAMQGRRYTAVILASNLTPNAINEVRNGYENLYTQLSAASTQQLAYSTNESLANAISRSKGYSDGTSQTITDGTSKTHTVGKTSSDTHGTSHTDNKSKTKKGWGAIATSVLGGALSVAGGILTATGAGAAVGVPMMLAGTSFATIGGAGATKTKGTSDGTTDSHTNSTSSSDAFGETHSTSNGTSHTETFSETNGQTATIGGGKNFTLTLHNKHVEEIQKRIDKQLSRIDQAESTGLWSTAAYFFSYDNDVANAETGATIFKSIMQGETSGVEASAVNTWYGDANGGQSKQLSYISKAIQNFKHPVFNYTEDGASLNIPVENSSLLSSKELAMMIGLPRKSVPGLPVVEHVSLAKEVVKNHFDKTEETSIDETSVVRTKDRELELGCIFDLGIEYPHNEVNLSKNSLAQHVFVTGSTGCGKSETVYKLIDEARHAGVKYMVIEPAKGEYKNVFGDATVYGTNSWYTPLLHINPFRFPKGIHVLEHVDRLSEIFNVCWPMYAAMPAVLKKAILKAYENCGWNLSSSSNRYSDNIFPTFSDLLEVLGTVINSSAYSADTKGDYTGSLVTRVESLTNGITGELFTENEKSDKEDELSDHKLFDENVIIDLSRIGSQETKALIMGILVMRLSEYRMVNATEANSQLSHLTVLEEAHNILKRTSKEQSMEGSNLAGKSVEMITNAIAEMRTYGEGFVIVDQSPTSVDEAAIKNTNTKIIMRLPEAIDRQIAGKAAGMKDYQIDEIAKLPTGVAVVYQNDWVSPVLCKVQKFEGKRIAYHLNTESNESLPSQDDLTAVVDFLMKGRVKKDNITVDISRVKDLIPCLKIPTKTKITLLKLVKEYEEAENISLWKKDYIRELSHVVTTVLDVKYDVYEIVSEAGRDFGHLNSKLNVLIASKVKASPSMNLGIKQCLMYDYASLNAENRKYALEWQNDLIRSHRKQL